MEIRTKREGGKVKEAVERIDPTDSEKLNTRQPSPLRNFLDRRPFRPPAAAFPAGGLVGVQTGRQPKRLPPNLSQSVPSPEY